MSNNDNKKELTTKEKLALTAFQNAVKFAGGPVTPGDVYIVLADKDDSNLPAIARSSQDIASYADSLLDKGYLVEVGRNLYRLNEGVFKEQPAQQSQT